MKHRLKSKWLWLGVAGLAYNVTTEKLGVNIAYGDWQTLIDVVSFIAIGVGVYSDHGEQTNA